MTSDLVTFVRARLDEDEQVARLAAIMNPGAPALEWSAEQVGREDPHTRLWGNTWAVLPAKVKGIVLAVSSADSPYQPRVTAHIARHDPARVLREVEAKRRMVDYLTDLDDKASDNNWWNLDTDLPFKLLAQPYADHPDYRAEWSP